MKKNTLKKIIKIADIITNYISKICYILGAFGFVFGIFSCNQAIILVSIIALVDGYIYSLINSKNLGI